MNGNVFFDTNIWIYRFAAPKKEADKEKKIIAGELIRKNSDNIQISNQILTEFSNALIKKFLVPQPKIAKYITWIQKIANISLTTINVIKAALAISYRNKINFYDAVIIASAIDDDCQIIYTEDLQNNQIFTLDKKKIKILNPFEQ